MTSPSGQSETGEVTAEQLETARKVHASFADPFAPPCTERADCNPCFLIARAFAKRDAAAERRGAEREREAWQAKLRELFPEDVRAAIRARSKP